MVAVAASNGAGLFGFEGGEVMNNEKEPLYKYAWADAQIGSPRFFEQYGACLVVAKEQVRMRSREFIEGFKAGYKIGRSEALNLMDYLVLGAGLDYLSAYHARLMTLDPVVHWVNDETASQFESPGQFLPQPPFTIPEIRRGFIYILRADNNLYKIGRAKRVDERVKQLGLILPYELEIVASFETDDMYLAEKQLHNGYRDRRIRGEWFALTDFDVRRLNQIRFYFAIERHDYLEREDSFCEEVTT